MSSLLRFLFLFPFICPLVPAVAQHKDWFSWASGPAGLDTALAFNIYVADLNNDGYPDMVTLRGNWGVNTPNTLNAYINVRDPASADPGARMFVDITGQSGVNMPSPGREYSRGVLVAALADVNNDGNIDLVRGAYYHMDASEGPGEHMEVLLGDGTGRFTLLQDNGLHELGVVNVTGMSFLDYDKDGNIDLFIARWFQNYTSNIWSPGILMKGNGDGTFRNVSEEAGITRAEPMYGCSVVDWNNDGWPDIVTAPYCRTGGQLWRNNGDGTFTDVAAIAGYNARYMKGFNGQDMCMWSSVPEDYDNDGDMDFFYVLVHGGNRSAEGRSVIALNAGAEGGYALQPDRGLVAKKSPFSSHNGDYDASWLDFDNDGRMDLAMVQGHYMAATDRLFLFYQDAEGKLGDITGNAGLLRAETKDLHMLEAIDYDRDGDDDIILCRNGQPRGLHLIENRVGQDNNWTAVELVAPAGVNRSCIGARIKVWSEGRMRMREVYAGRGNNGGQQPFAMIFGLGQQSGIDSIQVAWPDARQTVTTVRNPPVNRYLQITGSGMKTENGQEKVPEANLKVYPNPAVDYVLVQSEDNRPVQSVEIWDLLGRRLYASGPEGRITVLCPVAHLPQGVYQIRVQTTDGKIRTSRFRKQ